MDIKKDVKLCPMCNNIMWGSETELTPLYEKITLEENALLLMVKLLDNLEEFKELSTSLQSLMENNGNYENKLLSLFNVLINGIELEYKQLGHLD